MDDATPVPPGPPPGERLRAATPPALVIGTVIAWRLATHGPSPVLVGLGTIGTIVVVGSALRPARARRLVARVGAAVGGVVGAVAFTVLGLVAVLVPSAWQRLVRVDPLAGPERRAGTRWVERTRRDPRPARTWAPDPARHPVRAADRRRHRLAGGGVLAVVVLVLGSLTYVVASTRFTSFGILSPLVPARSVAPPFPDETPAAYEDVEWYDQHRRDIDWLWTVATAWDPFSMLRIRDVATPTVNVVDGVRRTWRPPPCDCERRTVWLYGGSAAFGLGQRDEHTIASELARAAWAEGVALDIDNRGVPGWLHWQAANRYAWDVATYGPPDLVLFYDGFNELFGLEGLDDVGDGYAPVDPYSAVYWRSLTDGVRAPRHPDGAGTVLPPPSLDAEAARTPEALVVARYERSRTMSTTTAAAHATDVRWFWQPTRWSRPPVEGEPDSGDHASWAAFDAEVRSLLPDPVVDLAPALADRRTPFFYDDVHHDEVLAALVAEAIWATLHDA